jgi:hypothetical protein
MPLSAQIAEIAWGMSQVRVGFDHHLSVETKRMISPGFVLALEATTNAYGGSFYELPWFPAKGECFSIKDS